MTARELLRKATGKLADAGCVTPKLDAECLLAHAWGSNRAGLIARSTDEVPPDVEAIFDRSIRRRVGREPLAYITGEKEFWSRLFSVNSSVLIPRPETEHLIEACLEAYPDRQMPLTICDIGTGSGCIAITLACEYPRAHVIATDISDNALHTAEANAKRYSITDRITFRQGHLFEALQDTDGPFDIIVSNPPYVAAHEIRHLEPELAFEPRHALTDDADGLRLLAEILAQGSDHLKSGGRILVETGPCGLPATPDSLQLERTIHDLAGHLRAGLYCYL